MLLACGTGGTHAGMKNPNPKIWERSPNFDCVAFLTIRSVGLGIEMGMGTFLGADITMPHLYT